VTALAEVSLFAGIGGTTLAAQRAGMTTPLVCEIDAGCRAVLSTRFPDAVIHPDVRELTADDLRRAGAIPDRAVVSAGWPCQGNSMAGGRRGMGDARSGLWIDVAASCLSDILETPGPHLLRFCLSPKACAGILRRTALRGRTLAPELADALRSISSMHRSSRSRS
jgi:hypothetical protein